MTEERLEYLVVEEVTAPAGVTSFVVCVCSWESDDHRASHAFHLYF